MIVLTVMLVLIPLDCGAGNDTLSGGVGNDTHIFSGSFGRDIINDDGTADKIQLNGSIISGTATYKSTTANGHNVYELSVGGALYVAYKNGSQFIW